MYLYDLSTLQINIFVKKKRKLTSRISQISTPSLNKTNARKLPLPGAKRTLRIGLRFVLNDLMNPKEEFFIF
jgi:hypothetical protein